VNKAWSILFGVVMLACLVLFIIAPLPGVGWWLPKNISDSGGEEVDYLFYLILGITGFFFVLTEVLLVYFMYVYAGRPKEQEHPAGHHYAEKKVFWTTYFKTLVRPVSALLHDQHRVELAWTIVPAVILLYIAFAQINTWALIKSPVNMPKDPDVSLEVSARMFEWRLRYPAPNAQDAIPGGDALHNWADTPNADDIHVVNEIHVFKGATVKVWLKTRDVIHSFYLPNLRLKQDALPGKTIPVWFRVKDYNTVPVDRRGRRVTSGEPGAIDHWVDGFDENDPDHFGLDKKSGQYHHPQQVWELACAELCGWGHFKMRGKLFVHKDKADYLRWLRAAQRKGMSTQAD
jgi:cytochrome c oxidase subunit 2